MYANDVKAAHDLMAANNSPAIEVTGIRTRLQLVSNSIDSLVHYTSEALDKVRGSKPTPVESGAASSRGPDSVEEWLNLIEARLQMAVYTTSQLSDRI